MNLPESVWMPWAMTMWPLVIFHFKDDLQYEDAIPMMRRLLELAGSHGLEFGVKITNTFLS